MTTPVFLSLNLLVRKICYSHVTERSLFCLRTSLTSDRSMPVYDACHTGGVNYEWPFELCQDFLSIYIRLPPMSLMAKKI